MEPERGYEGNTASRRYDSQSTQRAGNNAIFESRVQRMAPVIHDSRSIPGMPDPLNHDPTPGYPWAFFDSQGYSDHESITSSSDGASFATMSSLDTLGSAGMHSRISRLRMSHKPTQRKQRKEMKDLFEELKSMLPSLPKGAGEVHILTKVVEHLKKQTKSDPPGKIHELESRLHTARPKFQDVICQVQDLEQRNKQLALLCDDLQKQLEHANIRAKMLQDCFPPHSEVVGGSYSSDEALKHQKSPFDTLDDGLTERTPELNSQTPELSLQPLLNKLACPYYQRNPQMYETWKACSGPGFDSVHRLKEHLYRRHVLPSHCSRCYQVFQSDVELDCHIRQSPVCDVQESNPIQGFDKAQEKKLRSRKRTTTNEVEKWKETYRILFPDDDENVTPSPFFHTQGFKTDLNWCRFRRDELFKYKLYLGRELPRLISDELNLHVQQNSLVIVEAQYIQLLEIVRNCHDKAFTSYQLSNIVPLDSGKGLVGGVKTSDIRAEIHTAEASPIEDLPATVLADDMQVETPLYASPNVFPSDSFLSLEFASASENNGCCNSGYRPQLWPTNYGCEPGLGSGWT